MGVVGGGVGVGVGVGVGAGVADHVCVRLVVVCGVAAAVAALRSAQRDRRCSQPLLECKHPLAQRWLAASVATPLQLYLVWFVCHTVVHRQIRDAMLGRVNAQTLLSMQHESKDS